MSSHTCPRCGAVTDSVLPSGLCATCHGRADDTRQVSSAVADAPTPSFDPDAAGTLTFATPADTTLTPGGEADADPFGVLPPGGYQYGEVLGQGGMGVVYKAVRRSTGQTVAVKKLRPERCYPSLLRRFAREAQILGKLNHANVVRLDDFVPDPGDPHIVMEYIDGCTLADRLGDGKTLPPDAAARLVADAARGVQAAHAAGVVHRDLKPGNLLLTRDGRVKVSDFGLGKLTDPGDGVTLTGDGQLVGGTPGYMAPEQVDDTAAECDARTDVWGLGACLYACLVGKSPFPTGTRNATRVLSDPFVPPRAANPAVPAVLDAIVGKCLEKNPANRYQSAAAVADDLDRYRRGESTVAKPLGWAPRAWRRMRQVHRGLVAAWAVAAITGVIALLATPRPSGQTNTFRPPATGDEPKADVLATLKAEFNAGRTVTLVPEKGLPKWSEWVVGAGQINPSPNGDGSTHLQSRGAWAVEFLTPPGDRFEVEFEFRHLDGNLRIEPQSTWIGCYFGHERRANDRGELVDSLLAVRFADFDIDALLGKPPARRPVEAVHLCYPRMAPGAAREGSEHPLTTRPWASFPADPTWPGRWRRVRIEVTPEAVRLVWRGEQAESDVARVLSATDLDKSLADTRTGMLAEKVNKLNAYDLDLFPTRWKPDGGFGLLCSSSGMTVRNVTVKRTPVPTR